jgi:hypothetical protein
MATQGIDIHPGSRHISSPGPGPSRTILPLCAASQPHSWCCECHGRRIITAVGPEQLTTCFAFQHNMPWTQCTLRPRIDSPLTLALCRKGPMLELYLAEPGPLTSTSLSGKASATASTLMVSPPASRTQSPSYKSLAHGTATADLPPATIVSELAQWRTPYARWDRCLLGWGPRTSGRPPRGQ